MVTSTAVQTKTKVVLAAFFTVTGFTWSNLVFTNRVKKYAIF